MMDNFHFDIVSNSKLDEALAIAFLGSPGRKATHYRKDTNPRRLVLGWHEFKNSIELPAAVGCEDGTARALIVAWLNEQDYGPQPDHDGSNGRAWRLYNEAWGHVDNDPYAFLAVEPVWAIYGK